MNTNFPKFLKELNPNVYASQNFRVLDFETTSEEKGSALCESNRVLTWAGLDGRTGSVRCGDFREHGSCLDQLFKFLEGADFLVAQNAKFELQWLYRLGLEPGSVLVWDTMIADFCVAGNRKLDLSLEAIGSRYNVSHAKDFIHKLLEAGICPSEMPKKRLLESNLRDTRHTYDVFVKQREKATSLSLLPVIFTRCLTTLVLADIEKYGMCLDPKRVHAEYVTRVGMIREVEDDLQGITGGVNPRSPKQIAAYLYDHLRFEELKDYRGEPVRTGAGGRSTSANTIIALHAVTEDQRRFQDKFMEFSALKVAADSLTKMEECCAKSGGILRAGFNQTVAQNHRLTSTGRQYKLQLQNIDRDFKRLFKARHDGFVVAAPDAPQLEFRVGGDLTGDPQVLTDVLNDFDPHLFTAHIMGNVPMDQVSDELRTVSKRDTFKPVYGGSSGTPPQRRYYKAFKEKYNKMYKTQREWCLIALRDKQLRIPSGLIFYWPDIKMYPAKPGEEPYIKHQNKIFNYPISSIATADIMQITMVYAWYLMRGMKGYIINTIHDAVPAEVPESEVEEFWEICKVAFTNYVYNYLERVYGYLWTVPLGVDAKIGTHWDEGKKYKYKNATTPQLQPQRLR